MASRELKVNIIGDPSSLNKALGSATKSSDKFGSSLKTLGKVAAVGVGAAFAGLAATLKVGFDELADGQKVAAQTAAVLKSTGESANVTAKHVDSLATSLSHMSGVDDEVIGAGENMLLTFTNVRNEVGKGNDIFDQSTKILLDMSTALGTDMSKSAIQLGKALNDPVKGITALTRVGVTFTQGQKDQIKALVDSGHAMDAQKIILKELNKEFGGSAKAAGETLPGQLNKLRNSFEEAASQLAVKLLPALLKIVQFANDAIPAVSAFVSKLADLAGPSVTTGIGLIGDAFEALRGQAGFVEKHKNVFIAIAGAITGAALAYTILAAATAIATAAQLAFDAAADANPIGLIIIGIAGLTAAMVALYLTNEKINKSFNDLYANIRAIAIPTLAVIRQGWEQFGGALTAIMVSIVKTVTIPFQNAYDLIVGTFRAFKAAFTGDWRGLGTALLQIVDALGGNLVKAVLSHVSAALTAGLALGKAIINGIKKGATSSWPAVSAFFQGLPARIVGYFAGAGKILYNVGGEIINGLAKGVRDAAGGVLQSALNFVTGLIPSFIKKHLGISSPSKVTIEIGKQIAEGLGVGFGLGMVKVRDELGTKLQGAIDHMIAAVQAKQGAFGAAFDALTSSALEAFDKLSEGIRTKTEKLIARQDAQRAAKALRDSLAAAAASVSEAKGRLEAPMKPVTQNAGESDEDFQKRQADALEAFNKEKEQALIDYNQALADQKEAEFQIQRASDEKKAAAERTALDNRRGLQRKHFSDSLGDLSTALLNQEITVETFNKRLVKLFGKYHVPLGEQAKGMGLALAEGLNEAMVAVRVAAKQLAQTIAKELEKLKITVIMTVAADDSGGNPTHKASGGSFRKGQRLLVGERGPELVTFGSGGMVTPNNALGGGGMIENHIAVYLDGKQIHESVQRQEARYQNNNGRSAF